MKKILFVAFLLLLFSQNGISQTPPRIKEHIKSQRYSSQNTFQIYFEEFYDYDLFGNLILKETKEYTERGSLGK